MKKIYLLCITMFYINFSNAQIGIGTSHPDSSAQLEVSSTTKGFLLPRMNTVQRKGIVKPAVGLLVFDIDKNSLFLFDGARWTPIGTFAENDVLPFSRELAASQVNDHLGFSVAIDSNYAVIGAPLDSINGGGRQGAIYILKKDLSAGWQFQTKLTATDVSAGDYFGYAVSMKDNYIIAGTYNSTTAGAAYIFVRNGDNWTQQAKLTASDGTVGDMFGSTVAIYGDYAVAGAPKDDIDTARDCGAVYVFMRMGSIWTEQVKLSAPDKSSDDQFGKTLALDESRLLVGAPADSIGNFNIQGNYDIGSAYPYLRSGNTWTLLRKLREPQNTLLYPNKFAGAIALSGSTAVITDPGSDGAILIYRYRDTGLVYESTLYPPGAPTSTYYFIGRAAAVSGDFLALSAYSSATPVGAAVLCYKRAGTKWTLIKIINKVDASSTTSSLGRSVAIDGDTLDVLMGAPGGEINQNITAKGNFYFQNLQ